MTSNPPILATSCVDDDPHFASIRQESTSAVGAMGGPLWALTDQAVVSGGNFLTTVMLGRFAGPSQLGLYRMGMSLVVMLLSVPNALVWTPFNVRSLSMGPRRLASYTASSRLLIIWIGLVAACALGGASLVAKPSLTPLFGALAATVLLMLLRENVRRMAFARLDVRRALLLDAVAVGLQISGVYGLYWAGWLSGASAYGAVGISCLLVLGLGRLGANASTSKCRSHTAVSDFRKNWRLSRFVLVGALLYACTNGMYPWLLSYFAEKGGVETGELAVGAFAQSEAAVFLANPLLIAAGNFLGPAAAHALRDRGIAGLRRTVWFYTAAIVLTMLAFTAMLALFGPTFVSWLFHRDDPGAPRTIVALGLSQVAAAALIPVRSALFALHEGRAMAWGGLLRIACAATFGVWAVARWGAVGVGLGMLSGDLAALVMKLTIFHRRAAQWPSDGPALGGAP